MPFITITVADLTDSIAEHRKQIGSIDEQINKGCKDPVDPSKFSKYSFGIGRWLYGYALVSDPDQPVLAEIETIHAAICKAAVWVADRLNANDFKTAKLLFEEIQVKNARFEELLQQAESWFLNSGLEQQQHKLSVADKLDTFLQKQVSFKALSESTEVLILFLDQTRHVFYTNQAWIGFTGKDAADLAGFNWLNIISDQNRSAVCIAIQQALAGQTTEAFDVKAFTGEGKVMVFSLKIVPWLSDQDDISGCIVSLTDVDQLRKTEFDNRVKTAVLDHCKLIIGISLVGTMPEPIYNNPYTLQKLGWTTGKGRTLIDAVYPPDRDKVLDMLPGIIENKQGSHEIRLYNERSGEAFWVQWDVMVIKGDSDNDPDILFTISPDITDRRQQQKQLESHYQTLMNAVDVARLGTWEIDLITGATHFSDRHQEMFGIDTDMSLQQAIGQVVAEEQQNLRSAFFDAIRPERGGRFSAEYTIVNAKTGHYHMIQSVGQAYFDADGKRVNISGISQDITLFRDLQRALEVKVQDRTLQLDESNRQLEEGSRQMKQMNQSLSRSNEDLQRFAYVASHDLQEPLRKIQQFASRLEIENQASSDRARDYLRRMTSAAERMSALIDDLLSFSRVSNGSFKKQPVPVNKVIDQAISNLEDAVTRTGAMFDIGTLPVVEGNAVQLEQLFQNLVSNAVKFHQFAADGSIIAPVVGIYADLIDADDIPGQLKPSVLSNKYHRIRIADNGIGFDQVHLERIFQAFQRLHGRSQYSGTGIGLAICERIVQNHEGAITADSQVGQGATFSVFLPATS